MKIIINDNMFKCKVCNTPNTIINGMMGKQFNGFDGMFFMMPEKKEHEFWMYNCIIPLDIIMIDDNVITKINKNCKPCDSEPDCEKYNGFGNNVLELPGGTCDELGICEGDSIKTSIY
jgi:uncharacterized membrane protein (UPF0127 family)